jgi:hypothetical protein
MGIVMDRRDFSRNHEKSLRKALENHARGRGVLHAVQQRMDHQGSESEAIVGGSSRFRAALAQVSVVAPMRRCSFTARRPGKS